VAGPAHGTCAAERDEAVEVVEAVRLAVLSLLASAGDVGERS
jgi:hypothetical protein